MCRNILRKRLRKHIEKIHLHKVVFRGASGGCHDLRCERRGSEEARRPWLRHLAPSFISHFLRLQPKQKLTAQPWRCCIMVDRPIAGRRSKSRAACAALAKHPGIQYSEKSRCMKLQKNSRWCPVSLLIDGSLILLFTSFHIISKLSKDVSEDTSHLSRSFFFIFYLSNLTAMLQHTPSHGFAWGHPIRLILAGLGGVPK